MFLLFQQKNLEFFQTSLLLTCILILTPSLVRFSCLFSPVDGRRSTSRVVVAIETTSTGSTLPIDVLNYGTFPILIEQYLFPPRGR